MIFPLEDELLLELEDDELPELDEELSGGIIGLQNAGKQLPLEV